MTATLTRAQRILDPASAAARDAQRRKVDARRAAQLREVAEHLLTDVHFRKWLLLQLESVHFMRPAAKVESDFTRGHKHCVEEQLYKLVGAGGKAGVDFMEELARHYASLARSTIDNPEDKEP